MTKPSVINRFGHAKQLFESLRVEDEIFKMPESKVELGEKHALKRGSIKRLNDFLNPVLVDQDPDEGMEEEYKRKND